MRYQEVQSLRSPADETATIFSPSFDTKHHTNVLTIRKLFLDSEA
jgi:hypothetical protein